MLGLGGRSGKKTVPVRRSSDFGGFVVLPSTYALECNNIALPMLKYETISSMKRGLINTLVLKKISKRLP